MTMLFLAQLRYVNKIVKRETIDGVFDIGESGMDDLDAATYILHHMTPNVDDDDDGVQLYETYNSDPLFRDAVAAGGACVDIRTAIAKFE